jgi:8-oxo-dGTP pyrophosphatase MutT (NUDIX family)
MVFWTKDVQGKFSVLLGKRSFNPGKGKWSIPGGGWEPQDGFEKTGRRNYRQTAMREAQEELHFVPCFHFEVYAYILSEQAIPTYVDEFSELCWVSVKALPTPMVCFLRNQIATLTKKYPQK